MLDLHADIWSVILRYLNQTDLCHVIKTCKMLLNNTTLKTEMTHLKNWTEERADIKYINPDFAFISDKGLHVDPKNVNNIFIDNREVDTVIKLSGLHECYGYYSSDVNYNDWNYPVMMYTTNLNRYELRFIVNVDAFNEPTIGKPYCLRKYINLNKININYYSCHFIQNASFTDHYYQYPPKCKIHVKLKVINKDTLNNDSNYAFEFVINDYIFSVIKK